MPALLFLLRALVLVVMWGLVLAVVLTVRRDLTTERPVVAEGPTPRAPRRRAAPAAAGVPTRAPAGGRRSRSAARQVVVTAGPLAGTAVPLSDAPITIGRADDSTLVVSDDYVSTRHARLVPRGDAWLVEDLGSTNGTYLDRQRVTAPTPVPIGVPVRIGKTVLELRR